MPLIPPKGFTPLRDAGSAVLRLMGAENDPVANYLTRYRSVWAAVTKQTDLAEKIGGRKFVPDNKLPSLAVALGIAQASPREARPARKPSSYVASSSAAIGA